MEEQQGVRVWLGHMPAGLCVGEKYVRKLFRPVAELLSVQIHHDFADMSAEGFAFLTFATAEGADAAVRAVATDEFDPENRYGGGMQARLALRRGGAAAAERDEETVDLLLGRRVGNAFSQLSAGDDGDDDLRLLQSLSQSAFSQQDSQAAGDSSNKPAEARGRGRPKGKAKSKQPTLEDGGGGKRRRKARANSAVSPA